MHIDGYIFVRYPPPLTIYVRLLISSDATTGISSTAVVLIHTCLADNVT